MSCVRPLHGFETGGLTPNGKKTIVVKSHDTLDYYSVGQQKLITKFIEIPCGQCIGCRLQYSRQWADRCMMELNDHSEAYFLTLTYDDAHVPRAIYTNVDDSTGELLDLGESLTLRPRDLELFWKRLRKSGQDIRYFACGEYGDQTMRPHYHAIVYGLHLDDLQFYKMSGLSDTYWNSPFLEKLWHDENGLPLGYVVVGSVSWQSCAYVARYVVKKAKGKTADAYKKFNMYPEFVRMSRRPGIGSNYMTEKTQEFLDFGEVYLSSDKGSIRCKMPRYLKQKVSEDERYSELFEEVRQRSISGAEAATRLKLEQTDLLLDDLRKIEEAAVIERTKALKREI